MRTPKILINTEKIYLEIYEFTPMTLKLFKVYSDYLAYKVLDGKYNNLPPEPPEEKKEEVKEYLKPVDYSKISVKPKIRKNTKTKTDRAPNNSMIFIKWAKDYVKKGDRKFTIYNFITDFPQYKEDHVKDILAFMIKKGLVRQLDKDFNEFNLDKLSKCNSNRINI
jgi:hypothetical protein